MPLRDEERGVSSVVGFILVFGILVLLLAVYQSQIVPAQNAGTEFEHNQQVQRDMIELRNAILTAKTRGETTFAEVQLGTQYETRTFAINPAPPSGSLRTGPPEPIVVENDAGDRVTDLCPAGDPIQTRTLNYTPSYAEFENPPTIIYENTVLYLQFDDRTVPLTGQQLVQNGGSSVNLAPLNTTYSQTSSQTVSIEAVPGRIISETVENATVTLPTGLSESTWEDLLATQLPPSDVTVANGNLTIQTSGQIEIGCSPVGLGQAPAGGERVGGTGTELNPLDVQIRDFNQPGGNDEVEVTFNNTLDRDANVSEARITFYQNPNDQGGDIGPIEVRADTDGDAVLETTATLEVLGEFKNVDPTITFPGNGTETPVTFRNTGGEKLAQQDFFVVDFEFESGAQRRYFIDVPN